MPISGYRTLPDGRLQPEGQALVGAIIETGLSSNLHKAEKAIPSVTVTILCAVVSSSIPVRSRASLELELIALRHQVAVLRRQSFSTEPSVTVWRRPSSSSIDPHPAPVLRLRASPTLISNLPSERWSGSASAGVLGRQGDPVVRTSIDTLTSPSSTSDSLREPSSGVLIRRSIRLSASASTGSCMTSSRGSCCGGCRSWV